MSDNTDWQERSACRQLGPAAFDLFHDTERWAEAVAVCDTCIVWSTCVLANYREQLGVWGCSERARRRIRRLGRGASDSERLAVAYRANTQALADQAARLASNPQRGAHLSEVPVLVGASGNT